MLALPCIMLIALHARDLTASGRPAGVGGSGEQGWGQQYSEVADGRPQAMVLRMETEAIDWGVRFAELSQYSG